MSRASTDESGEELERLIVVGPSPPPVHGVSASIRREVDDAKELGAFAAHVDTRDTRALATLGRFDALNVLLGIKHAGQLSAALIQHRGAAVYVPLSQTRWAIYRDLLFVAIARLARRRIYLHLHGSYIGELYCDSGRALRVAIRWICGQAHAIWVLTPSLTECFRSLTPKERMRILPNAVDDPLADGRQRVARDLANGCDGLRILFLANLHPAKGAGTLLEALTMLGSRAAGWTVKIAGGSFDPAHDRDLQRLADSVVASVELLGVVDDEARNELLAWADVFTHPSTGEFGEGQPLAILEAMAAGLPVVATRIGGIPDTLADAGVLVAPRDPESLSEVLASLAESPEHRADLGQRARARYEHQYTPARHRKALQGLLTLR